MKCIEHELVYDGLVNIFDGDILLEVIESWKCKKCGATRVSIRGPGITGSTEGILGDSDPNEGRRWILVISKGVGSLSPNILVIPVMPGDIISINSPNEFERQLVVDEGYNLLIREDLSKPRHVVSYLLEEVIKGSIDLSSWPPSVISLRNQSK